MDRKVYYHVTYYKNLDAIGRRGLKPNARPNWEGRADLQAFSRKGLFLADQHADYWIDRLQDWADHHSDNVRKDGLIPIILRVRAIPSLAKPADYKGDPPGSWAYPKSVRTTYVEMWDGKQWTPNITRSAIDLSLFIEKDGYPGEGTWWVWKDPYPMPPEIT